MVAGPLWRLSVLVLLMIPLLRRFLITHCGSPLFLDIGLRPTVQRGQCERRFCLFIAGQTIRNQHIFADNESISAALAKPMDKLDLDSMSLDELWLFHEQITKVLSAKMIAQKHELEQRLHQLNSGSGSEQTADLSPGRSNGSRPRRKYPLVLPKFQNPSAPGETWSGRGKKPRWLVAALKAGSKIEEFEISGK
jgi:DNA-binding protein H-NS